VQFSLPTAFASSSVATRSAQLDLSGRPSQLLALGVIYKKRNERTKKSELLAEFSAGRIALRRWNPLIGAIDKNKQPKKKD
jgi:hypothetical protein